MSAPAFDISSDFPADRGFMNDPIYALLPVALHQTGDKGILVVVPGLASVWPGGPAMLQRKKTAWFLSVIDAQGMSLSVGPISSAEAGEMQRATNIYLVDEHQALDREAWVSIQLVPDLESPLGFLAG